MTDERSRALERAAVTGDLEARKRLAAERVRSGQAEVDPDATPWARVLARVGPVVARVPVPRTEARVEALEADLAGLGSSIGPGQAGRSPSSSTARTRRSSWTWQPAPVPPSARCLRCRWARFGHGSRRAAASLIAPRACVGDRPGAGRRSNAWRGKAADRARGTSANRCVASWNKIRRAGPLAGLA